MSGDLLRYLSGPTPYSPWWMVLAAAVLLVVIGWCAGVLIWTLPSRQLRALPGIRVLHGRVIRHRFAATIRATSARHRAGELTAMAAAATMSRTVRSFLALTSERRVQYLHVNRLASHELASAAPILLALNDIRYNADSKVDLARAARDAEQVIRTWV